MIRAGLLFTGLLAGMAGLGQSRALAQTQPTPTQATPAQPIPVQSGEHATFSRLVFALPTAANWSLAQDGTRATISFTGAKPVLDVSQVFDKIPRDRIGALTQIGDGGPLTLALNCECDVSAFVQAGGYLVVDVSSPSETAAPADPTVAPADRAYRFSGFEGQSDPWVPETLGQITHVAAHSQPPQPPVPVARPVPTAPSSAPAPHSASPTEPGLSPADLDDALATLPDPATADVLSLSQMRLQEQIARAANQGLLTPRGSDFEDKTAPPKAEMKASAASGDGVPLSLDATTRADRDKSQIRMRNADTPNSRNCIPSDAVNVALWSDEDGFRHGLGRLRAQLYSDTGSFRTDDALKLAKFYVHHGFGQEAVGLLRRSDMTTPTARLVLDIAQLIDGDTPGHISELGGQAGCTTDIALWSFLAPSQTHRAPETDEADAIMRAFSKLPLHLRHHLGPRLSRQFLKVGNTTRASDVLRAIDQGAVEHPVATQMAQAEIDLHRGEEEQAKERLDEVITDQGEHSPEALATLIETQHANGAQPDEALSDLAAAYAAELRGSELGDRMQRAMILALTMEDQFGAALSALNEVDHSVSATARRTHADVMAALAERGDDVTFLSLAMQELAHLETGISPSVGNAVAARLLNLGFSDAAGRILSQPLSARKTEDRRLLRARIALVDGLPNRALVELAGLSSDAAEALRAEAWAQSGEFRSAADSFERANDPENVARAYWLDGAWDLVPQAGSGRFGVAASLAESLNDAPPIGPGPLGEARALLDASERTREDVENLLSSVTRPASDPASDPTTAGGS